MFSQNQTYTYDITFIIFGYSAQVLKSQVFNIKLKKFNFCVKVFSVQRQLHQMGKLQRVRRSFIFSNKIYLLIRLGSISIRPY